MAISLSMQLIANFDILEPRFLLLGKHNRIVCLQKTSRWCLTVSVNLVYKPAMIRAKFSGLSKSKSLRLVLRTKRRQIGQLSCLRAVRAVIPLNGLNLQQENSNFLVS